MQAQFALYFNSDLERPADLWENLHSEMGKFDQSPVIIPIPNEPALIEVPIVQVVSKNSSFRLNIGKRRLDFFVYSQEGKDAVFENTRNLLLNSAEILTRKTREKIEIQWIGLVLNFFIIGSKPQEVISKLLDDKFKKIHQGNTQEASIDYIAQIKALNKKINNHTHLQAASAKFKDEEEELEGMILSRDFNTKPENSSSNYIDEEFVKEFLQFSEVSLNIEEIKALLWKEQV